MVHKYTEAIELTTKTIDGRAGRYRNQVIAIIAVIVTTIIVAIATGSFRWLAGLFLMPPIVAFFVAMDLRHLRSWQHYIFEALQRKELEPASFTQALKSVPTLPGPTLDSMLKMLPAVEQGQIWATHKAVLTTKTLTFFSGVEQTAYWINAINSLIAAICVGGFIVTGYLPLLAGLVLMLALRLLRGPITKRQFERWLKTILPDFRKEINEAPAVISVLRKTVAELPGRAVYDKWLSRIETELSNEST